MNAIAQFLTQALRLPALPIRAQCDTCQGTILGKKRTSRDEITTLFAQELGQQHS